MSNIENASKLLECVIVVVDDVNHRRETFYSPQPLEDAERNEGHVRLAREWIDFDQDTDLDEIRPAPIACCVMKDEQANAITVRWYPTSDDPEAARVALGEVLSGAWRNFA